MPMIKQVCDTKQAAVTQLYHWSRQFAGIKMLDFFTTNGDRVCYGSVGNYLFTVPAEECKKLNLKP